MGRRLRFYLVLYWELFREVVFGGFLGFMIFSLVERKGGFLEIWWFLNEVFNFLMVKDIG